MHRWSELVNTGCHTFQDVGIQLERVCRENMCNVLYDHDNIATELQNSVVSYMALKTQRVL